MKKTTLLLVGLVMLAPGAVTAQAAGVGFSITVGQPGFFGRINVRGYPVPEVIYGRPMLAEPDYGYPGSPIYLHVPRGWASHWRRHCAEFRACYRPVYFVRDSWYNEVYVPRYRRERDWNGGRSDDGYRERGWRRVDVEHERPRDHWRNRDRGWPNPERGDSDH